jgi:lipoprotein-releasing system permease protein
MKSGRPPEPGLAERVYQTAFDWVLGQPVSVQIALGLGVALSVLAALLSAWFRLPPRFRAGLRFGLMVLSGIAGVGLGAYSLKLPEGRLVGFNPLHQAMRSGATLSLTVFVVMAFWAAVPVGLKVLEAGGFRSFVAARHLRSKKSGFLTAISALSILGVGLSSFALCAVISVMGGFGADLKQKILNNDAHIRIETPEKGGLRGWGALLSRVQRLPGVSGAMPVVSGEVMASSSTNTAGMIVRGVDTKVVGSVIDIPRKVEVGSFRFLDDPKALLALPPGTPIGVSKGGEVYYTGPGLDGMDSLEAGAEDEEEEIYPGIVLGAELSSSLHAYVGDLLTLVSPMGDLGPIGLIPRTRKFRVAGIFYSGMYEYDAAQAYMSLRDAAELFDMGEAITTIDLRVANVIQVGDVTPQVRRAVHEVSAGQGEYSVRDWKEMNKNLFTALELEKIASFIVLSIAIAVASFCIICTLLLMVTEKSKEIAILKAMGASDSSVLRLFMTEGMMIGSVGTIIGVSAGYVQMKGLSVFGLRLDPEVYYVERLPVHVDVSDYLLIALASFVITTLATMYPAYAASRLRPVEGIRHD